MKTNMVRLDIQNSTSQAASLVTVGGHRSKSKGGVLERDPDMC